MIRPRVLVLRAVEDAPPLCRALEARGLEAVSLPLLEFAPGPELREMGPALAGLERGWVVLTSGQAAGALERGGPLPAGVRIAVVGKGTTEKLTRLGRPVDLLGEGSGALGLVKAFASLGPPAPGEQDVLWITGDRSLPELPRGLAALGYRVRSLIVYRTVLRRPAPAERHRALEGTVAACFTSPSTVEGLLDGAGDERLQDRLLAAALGPATAAALERAGFRRIRTAPHPSPEALALTVAQALSETTS